MDNLVRDPLWNFVGVVLAIIALLVTIVIFIVQRKKKRLSYQVISLTSLLGLKEEIAGKIKVLYEGNEVTNVHLFEIKLINTGNQPIASSDFERPICISFADVTTILTSEIYESNPKDIKGDLAVEGCSLAVKPLLLNPNDSLSIKTLISNFDGSFTVDGRIIGVRQITEYREKVSLILLPLFLLSILLILTIKVYILRNYGETALTLSGKPIFFVLLLLNIVAVTTILWFISQKFFVKTFKKLWKWLNEYV
jgi:hypothetical protein